MSRNKNRNHNQQQKEQIMEQDQNTVVVENLQPEVVDSEEQAAEQGNLDQAGSVPLEQPAQVVQPVQVQSLSSPVKEPVVTKTIQTKEAVVVDDVEEKIKALRKSGSTMQKLIIDFFDNYMEAVKPGKQVTDKELYRAQFSMWTMFDTILEHSSDDEFSRLWNLILGMFNRLDVPNKTTALSDTHIHRGLWMWPNGDKRAQALQQIINLVKLTKNPEERQKGLRQVDMEKALKVGFSDRARGRLLSFYGK